MRSPSRLLYLSIAMLCLTGAISGTYSAVARSVAWSQEARALRSAARAGNRDFVIRWMRLHRNKSEPSAFADAVIDAAHAAQPDSEGSGTTNPNQTYLVWKSMVDECADPNEPIAQHLFCQSIGGGELELAEHLLKRGTLPDARELGGYTALKRAVVTEREDMVILLLNRGARDLDSAITATATERDTPALRRIEARLRSARSLR